MTVVLVKVVVEVPSVKVLVTTLVKVEVDRVERVIVLVRGTGVDTRARDDENLIDGNKNKEITSARRAYGWAGRSHWKWDKSRRRRPLRCCTALFRKLARARCGG